MNISWWLALLLVIGVVHVADAFDVDGCHWRVPDSAVGVLTADLDCVGDEPAVFLGEGATLQMNGHRVSGGFGASSYMGIECTGEACAVVGPGEIDGFVDPFYGVGVGGTAERVVLSDLDIHNNHRGVFFLHHKTKIAATDVNVHDNVADGIWGAAIRATNLVANKNGGMGVRVERLNGQDVLRRSRLRGTGIVASDNGMEGVYAGAVAVDGLTAERNGRFGLNAHGVRLANATLTGNCTALPAGSVPRDVDLASARPPKVVVTTCGRSARIIDDALLLDDWDICSED